MCSASPLPWGEHRRPTAAVLEIERQCFGLATAKRRVRGYSLSIDRNPSLTPTLSQREREPASVAARSYLITCSLTTAAYPIAAGLRSSAVFSQHLKPRSRPGWRRLRGSFQYLRDDRDS